METFERKCFRIYGKFPSETGKFNLNWIFFCTYGTFYRAVKVKLEKSWNDILRINVEISEVMKDVDNCGRKNIVEFP